MEIITSSISFIKPRIIDSIPSSNSYLIQLDISPIYSFKVVKVLSVYSWKLAVDIYPNWSVISFVISLHLYGITTVLLEYLVYYQHPI